MTTAIHQQVEAARNGTNNRIISQVTSGWVVLSEKQVLPGYCLLLPDPVVTDLNALSGASRARFLVDMALLGDALLQSTDAARINYAILGNQDPALHAHVIPRFDDEPEETRTKPIWFSDWDAAPTFDIERDRPLIESIRQALEGLGAIS